MSLDVYVMPLWRFKAGLVTTTAQRLLGVQGLVLSPGGVQTPPPSVEPGSYEERMMRRRAEGDVRKIIEAVERNNGVRVAWKDEGDIVYQRQAHGSFAGLRAYARWVDLRDRLGDFARPPRGDYYSHPALVQEHTDRPMGFPHLVQHDLHSGYYLPCEFEKVTYTDPFTGYGSVTFQRAVGSSLRLLVELEKLNEHLQVPDEYRGEPDDHLASVKAAWVQLREMACLSCDRDLPIVFWG